MLTTLTSGRSIGQRLGLVLSLVLLVSFVGSGLGYRALSRVAEENKEMLESSLTSERLASDWYRNITNGAARTSAVAVSKDPALADFFAPVSAESSKQSGELQKRLKESLTTPDELAMFDKVSEARKAYLSSRDAVFAAKKAGDDAKAQQAFEGQFVPANKQFLELMDKLLQTQRQELDAAAARAQDANVSARIALAVFSVCALIVGIGLSVFSLSIVSWHGAGTRGDEVLALPPLAEEAQPAATSAADAPAWEQVGEGFDLRGVLEARRLSIEAVERIGRITHGCAGLYSDDAMHAMAELLGRPEQAYPTIHLTGTNGKGSTSTIASMLLLAMGGGWFFVGYQRDSGKMSRSAHTRKWWNNMRAIAPS